jgi:(methylthio)acryloyl-CoA hydratase
MSEISTTHEGAVAHIRIERPHKRNAISDSVILALEAAFAALPESCRAVVISGQGEHFCAGLDLSEIKGRTSVEGLHHSRQWHRVFDQMELASTCHIRVADETAFFAFPEGARGIFVGGGGSVRAPKLIGTHRMLDMMLTGRVYKAAEAVPVGFAQYLVPAGEAIKKAMELAQRISTNAPMTNYALIQALPRITEIPADHGLLMESLMASVVETAPEAQARVQAFLDGRGPKVKA